MNLNNYVYVVFENSCSHKRIDSMYFDEKEAFKRRMEIIEGMLVHDKKFLDEFIKKFSIQLKEYSKNKIVN